MEALLLGLGSVLQGKTPLLGLGSALKALLLPGSPSPRSNDLALKEQHDP